MGILDFQNHEDGRRLRSQPLPATQRSAGALNTDRVCYFASAARRSAPRSERRPQIQRWLL